MRKNVLWMLTAILTCGLGMTMLTACTNNDNPDIPQPVVEKTLIGDWFTTINRDWSDEEEIVYAIISFSENGVCTTRSIQIYPDAPVKHNERIRRHSIYTVNEAAGTITLNREDVNETNRYQLTENGLALTAADGSYTFNFHRPTSADLAMINAYEQTIESDDYVGKWFKVNEINGLYTYTMLDLTDNGVVNMTRYSVNGDDCQRTTSSRLYGEYDDAEYNQVLEVHNEKNYHDTTLYRWAVKDNQLHLSNMTDDFVVFHPLTPADMTLMAELDKKAEAVKPVTDQVSLFLKNIQNDRRYKPSILSFGDERIKYLHLGVSNYEEALEEFLKLLPEGVASTAVNTMEQKDVYTEFTSFTLQSPQHEGGTELINIYKVSQPMNNIVGYAWVTLTKDLSQALNADAIFYMPKTSDNDLENFVTCLTRVMSYCKPDPEDPTQLICTFPSEEVYLAYAPAFLTTKMIGATVVTADNDGLTSLTDKDGNILGHMTLHNSQNITNGASAHFSFDEQLQASIQAAIGATFSQIWFFVAEKD